MSNLSQEWRQGAIVEFEGSEWVLLTHCCDIHHKSRDSEPNVELGEIIRESDLPDKSFIKGKNPRVLHLPCSQGHRLVISSTSRRIFLSKERLVLECNYVDRLSLDQRNHLRFWIGRRYTRVAFADAFNFRFNKAASLIRTRLKKVDADKIYGLYFLEEMAGDLQVEKAADEHYEAQLWLVVTDGADTEVIEALESLADRVERETRTAGLDLDVRVLCSTGITLNEFENAVHWSELDWMSN